MSTPKKVPIRPPKGVAWQELFRYDEGTGEFIPDDGQPGLAFFGKTVFRDRRGGYPYAFSYGTKRHYVCPPWHEAAMSACVKRYGVANGRRVTTKGEWA